MQKKNSFFITIVIIIGVFVIFNPFTKPKQPRPHIPHQSVASLLEYVQKNPQKPEELVCDFFVKHDLVFLGDIKTMPVKQNINFIRKLIPYLMEYNVNILAMEFIRNKDQVLVDELLQAENFDETKARQILFNFNIQWGYQEHIELLKSIWEINREKSSNFFRVIGLYPDVNWQVIQTQDDMKNVNKIKNLYFEGFPNDFMADIIKKQIVEQNKKALIYTTVNNAFTHFVFKGNTDSFLQTQFGRMPGSGEQIYSLVGDKAVTVLFHFPWFDMENQNLVFPLQGYIDELIARLGKGYDHVGLHLANTPFADLMIETGFFITGYDTIRFEDLCHGYILQGSMNSYRSAEPIAEFINEDNYELALQKFPGPKPGKQFSIEKLNKNNITMRDMVNKFFKSLQ